MGRRSPENFTKQCQLSIKIPIICVGPAVGMSLLASRKIYNLSREIEEIPNEDVFFTGVLREKLSISLKWDRPDVRNWERFGKMTVDGEDPIGTVFQTEYYGNANEEINGLENLKISLKSLQSLK